MTPPQISAIAEMCEAQRFAERVVADQRRSDIGDRGAGQGARHRNAAQRDDVEDRRAAVQAKPEQRPPVQTAARRNRPRPAPAFSRVCPAMLVAIAANSVTQ